MLKRQHLWKRQGHTNNSDISYGGDVSSDCPLERFHYPLFIYPLHLSSFSLPPTALAIPHSGSLSFLCAPLTRHPH